MDVNLVTALVPSETACLASSPGRRRRTEVLISRDRVRRESPSWCTSAKLCNELLSVDQQDMSLYEQSDTSSPTAQLASVYMVASIAATERRSVATVDFPGACLNAELKEEVFIRIEVLMGLAPERIILVRLEIWM